MLYTRSWLKENKKSFNYKNKMKGDKNDVEKSWFNCFNLCIVN